MPEYIAGFFGLIGSIWLWHPPPPLFLLIITGIMMGHYDYIAKRNNKNHHPNHPKPRDRALKTKLMTLIIVIILRVLVNIPLNSRNVLYQQKRPAHTSRSCNPRTTPTLKVFSHKPDAFDVDNDDPWFMVYGLRA